MTLEVKNIVIFMFALQTCPFYGFLCTVPFFFSPGILVHNSEAYDLRHNLVPVFCLYLAFVLQVAGSNAILALQFIREYTGKVDELIKDKIEALKEVKAKENEEKDVIKQQVLFGSHF